MGLEKMVRRKMRRKKRASTAEEVRVAEKALNMLSFSYKVIKGSLIIITEVADQLHPVAEDDDNISDPAPITIFSSPAVSEEQCKCQEWVAGVVQSAVKVEKSAMNIGAELYSPCENPEDVGHITMRACKIR